MPVEEEEETQEGEQGRVVEEGRLPQEVEAEHPEGPAPEDDDLSTECAPERVIPDPGQPTRQQIEDHRVDHLPYRSWCPECVAGRATGE